MFVREEAYRILYKFSLQKDINLKEELDRVLPLWKKREDRALITHIVYGVVRYLLKIEWIIRRLTPGKRISKKVRVLLWIGIYSFLEFERIPHYATVSELVEIAKHVERGGAYRFVNAILRKYLRERESISIPSDPSVRYSFPSWFVDRWKKRLPNEYIDFLSANNKIPPESIRVNTLKISPSKLVKLLYEEGVEKIEEGRWEDALRIYGYPYIQDIPSYKKGYFTVQDEGAMWVSRFLYPLPGETVMDLCSYPGGKAFHIAIIMKNQGRVYTVDIKDKETIEEGARRLGISIIEPLRFDLREKREEFYRKADRVLIDAPCTSLGTIRRRPELKWKKSPKDIKRLSSLQLTLLENASLYVKPNGILVYSVCTLEREETDDVIEGFLKKNKKYRLLEKLSLYPHRFDTDGFFMAKLKRDV